MKPEKWKPEKITCLHCSKRQHEAMNGYCQECLNLVGDCNVGQLRGRRRCLVLYCSNYTDQGLFVGDLCAPCHTFVMKGEGRHSQAFRNSLRTIATDLTNLLVRVLDPTMQGPSIADDELRKLIRG